MENKNLYIISFSPTGTTKKVLNAIADGMNFQQTTQIDLIKKNNIKKQNFTDEDWVIIGVPVYSSRIPETVINRLQKFRANKTNAVVVVVYGNRQYGDALLELKNLVVELGFFPKAAAAFIGLHSFSSENYPIAVGRPDSEDLQIAKNFGKQVIRKQGEYKEIEVPGNFPYRERSKKLIVKPNINLTLCNQCGLCQEVCPVDAISISKNEIETNEQLCIYCNACVRVCPQNARIIDDEKIIGFAKNLHEKCKQPKSPEIFL